MPSLPALSAPGVLGLQQAGGIVLDTRPGMQFVVAHVPGSVHIALPGQYASWAARITGLDMPLIIAGEDPEHGVIENSLGIPLVKPASRLAELDREKLLVVHCKGGY